MKPFVTSEAKMNHSSQVNIIIAHPEAKDIKSFSKYFAMEN